MTDFGEIARNIVTDLCVKRGQYIGFKEKENAYLEKSIVEAMSAAAISEKAKLIASVTERIVLEQTCGACPEQYDAKLDGAQVGYLRLRHGMFRVDFPECGEMEIFFALPNGDGAFNDEERDGYLFAAKRAIAEAIVLGSFQGGDE